MTPKVFLTTAIAAAALVFAVPALADTPGEESPAAVRVSPDRADRAAAARQSERSSMLDTRESRAFAAKRKADTTGAQARTTVDPLAVSRLLGQGYTQPQVEAWTVGACSHEVKPAACFGPSKGANLTDGAAKVDPLAESYLIGQGLSANEVKSWTVGACSHEVKAASCSAIFEPTAAASTPVVHSIGFNWGDAGIGAGATLGIVFLLGGIGAGLASRHNRHRPTARA
jgi:hypothetical protein